MVGQRVRPQSTLSELPEMYLSGAEQIREPVGKRCKMKTFAILMYQGAQGQSGRRK